MSIHSSGVRVLRSASRLRGRVVSLGLLCGALGAAGCSGSGSGSTSGSTSGGSSGAAQSSSAVTRSSSAVLSSSSAPASSSGGRSSSGQVASGSSSQPVPSSRPAASSSSGTLASSTAGGSSSAASPSSSEQMGSSSHAGSSGADVGSSGPGVVSSSGMHGSGSGPSASSSSDGTSADGGVSTASILQALENAGFTASLAEVREDGAVLIELGFNQPNDHHNPQAGTHPQHPTLIHRGFDRPTVVISTGYNNYLGFDEDEISAELGANQLVLDKRFHNGEGTDWSLFTREQVAADAHEIITRLKVLYVAPWVSTGGSNGGVDVVSFRRYHPDDVAGTVALGAAIMTPEDPRFLPFFGTVDAACQQALVDIQGAVLGPRREAIKAEVDALIAGLDTFTRVEFDAAYEAAALSYPWLFWQYWGTPEDCAALPTPDATDTVLADEFFARAGVFGAFPMSDAYLAFFGPYFYETQRDLGWPALPRAALEQAGLIRMGLVDMERGLVPEGVPAPTFDTAGNASLRAFAATGSGVIFLYSNQDPWSAAAVVPEGPGTNVAYWVTGGNHLSGIGSLAPADRAAVWAQLRAWAGR